MKKQPETPREAAIWPELEEIDHHDQPVNVMIRLEKPVYDWLKRYVEEHNSSVFSSFERSVETLIRAMAKDDWTLERLASVVDDNGEIKWPPSKVERGSSDLDEDFPF